MTHLRLYETPNPGVHQTGSSSLVPDHPDDLTAYSSDASFESTGRALNKLIRTFLTVVDALKRYRTGGEQKVTVQHVTVEGGQAIVGNVTQAPREVVVAPDFSSEPLVKTKEQAAPAIEDKRR